MIKRLLYFLPVILFLSPAAARAQCVALFTGDTSVCVGDTAFFTNMGSGLSPAFSWDFGDGTSDTVQNPAHVYASAGTYSVKLVINDGLCLDSFSMNVHVSPLPQASFTTDTSCTSSGVQFTANYNTGAGDTISSVNWYFGAGDSSSDLNPFHTYQQSGYDTISVQMETSRGCRNSLDTVVFIYQKPLADFLSDTLSCFGDSVSFVNNTPNYQAAYSWNFGDVFSGQSNTSTLENPLHRFSSVGSYNVTLVVSDIGNCADTVTIAHRSVTAALANFTVNNACQNLNTAFTSTSSKAASDSITGYYWDFDNGNSDTLSQVTTSYPDTGQYNVLLRITTRAGCIDSITKQIAVLDQPTATKTADTICGGSDITFAVDAGTETVTAYSWNFGDGTSSASASPIHQYNLAGNYYTSVTLTYSNTGKCETTTDSILVHALPSADFEVLSDTQCFNGNSICIKLLNQSNKLISRSITWNDGTQDNSSPLTDTIVCHSFIEAVGGVYSITVQAIDSNLCSQTETQSNAVTIFPTFNVDFTVENGSGCFYTTPTFTNQSLHAQSEVESFYWDFGDGSRDSTNWSIANHAYSTDGYFDIKLWAVNTNGCSDSLILFNGVHNTLFNIDAKIDSTTGLCVGQNTIYFSQTPIPGAEITWSPGGSSSWNSSFSYQSPGTYFISVFIETPECDTSFTVDTVNIAGPVARISSITNRYQCEIQDTVYFFNGSTFHQNGSRLALWDFGDPFAPACTTDTKNNINVAGNCRYSVDSFTTKHFYPPGQEDCYMVTLLAYDTVTACSSSTTQFLALERPFASADTAADPERTGMRLLHTQSCLGPESGKHFTLDLSGTQPSCGRQSFWIMWDSTCAAQSGNFEDNWELNITSHNYGYDNKPCDPNGFVTIGLIIQNGSDSSGNICRDTAWYHNYLWFSRLDPRFTTNYDSTVRNCANSTFHFKLKDTLIQSDSISSIVWDWGDGTSTTVNDTSTVSHTYNGSGIFMAKIQLVNSAGCSGTDSIQITVGTENNLSADSQSGCIGDTFTLNEQIRYWKNATAYWSDPSRAAAGKETVYWNLGDGNGFSVQGGEVQAIYNQAGDYYIQMAIRDSLGCWDTVTHPDPLKVYGIFADFATPDDTVVCAQVVSFQNNSTVYDSTAGFVQPDDEIASYLWTFENGITNQIPSPVRYMNVGEYSIRLVVENVIGCRDSVEKELVVLGPVASFEIVSDSFGCAPLNVTFKNTGIEATGFIWKFGDEDNNTFTTLSDTNVTFSYTDYGSFFPTVVAQGKFIKNGIQYNCNSEFPDTVKAGLREVTVYEVPQANFTYSNDCATGETHFSDSSVLASGAISSYLWDFGDGDTSSQANPIHEYSDTGSYTVILKIFTAEGCSDSVVKTIAVSLKPTAWFTYNEVCVGAETQFTDQTNSFNDVIYKWEWDFGNGTTSTLTNPAKTFGADSVYTISLKVTNIGGCSDSIARNVSIHSFPTADFAFNDICEGSQANFSFNGSSNETPLSYLWLFHDGSTSTDSFAQKTYSSEGTFPLKLKVTTPYSCADSFTDAITVYPVPVASFSVNNSTQCFDLQNFIFTNTGNVSSGSFSSIWNFGDGDSSSSLSPNHTYADTGSYEVKLLLATPFGCKDSQSQNVVVNASPEADFSIMNDTQCLSGNDFAFTDLSIYPGSYSRSWSFGDMTFGSDSLENHSYSSFGSFNIKLVITTPEACSDSTTKNIEVMPMPQAGFNITDDKQCLSGNDFEFVNTSTPEDSLTFYWMFGDGDTSSAENPFHQYPLADTFEISLIADFAGCKDTLSKTAVVFSMPVADFTVDNDSQCLSGNVFLFDENSTDSSGINIYQWDFGDGNTDNSANPSHSYVSDSLFTVKLLVTANTGCLDSTDMELAVHPMPEPAWGVNDSGQCVNAQDFLFGDSSTINSGTYSRLWDFGDGTTGNLSLQNKSFSVDGTYEVSLILESGFGCIDSLNRNIIVFPKPEPDFTINDSGQCYRGHNFISDNLSGISSGTLSYDWNFGDGTSSTAFEPQKTYSVFGDYSIRLLVTSNNNCVDSVEKEVRVFAQPAVQLTVNDSQQCFRDHEIQLSETGSVAAGTYSRLWDFGDGNTDTSKNTNHTYASFGNYLVWLKLTSDNNCTDSISQNIEIYAQPGAAFTVNDSGQCYRGHNFITDNLSAISSGTVSYDWNFGDGTSSTAFEPQKTYSLFGDYNIRLLVTSNNNCVDSVEKEVRVFAQPAALLTVNDSQQCFRDHEIQLTETGSLAAGTYTLLWDFGDGITATAQNVNHTYASFGDYVVWLKLTSDNNCTDSISQNIEIYAQPGAGFTVNDSIQCERGHQFVFGNQSNVGAGSNQYTWDFGDGNSSASADPVHTYSAFGTYDVQLLAYSNHNCRDSIVKVMRVDPMPETKFWLNDTGQCVNTQSFDFIDSSSIAEGILSRHWYLGDGNESLSETFSHSYAVYGDYTVKLVQVSDKHCRDSLMLPVRVFAKPEPMFSVNDSDQCVNTNVYAFNNQSTVAEGSMSYNWDFGDGNTHNIQDPDHTYSLADTFLVRLLNTSNFGCTDSFDRFVIVFPKPQTAFTVNDTDQCINTNHFTFTANAAISSGNLTQYWWDLGSGPSSGDLDTALTYLTYGTENIEFISESEFFCYDTSRQLIEIYPKPMAVFSVNDSDQCVNTNLFSYSNTTSIPYGSLSWLWEFGDGDTSSLENPDHTFAFHDTLTTVLYAKSGNDCYDTTSRVVVILPKPDPMFQINDTGQCVNGNHFIFTNQSEIDYGILTYRWDLDFGTFATATDTQYVYPIHNTYNIELYAVSDALCSDSLTRQIVVYPKPNPLFGVNDEGQCENDQSFNINNQTNIAYGSLQYFWDFGDGEQDTASQPVHEYLSFGGYTISLLVVSDYGCQDTASLPVRVFAKPHPEYFVNDSTQCINFQNFQFTDQSNILEGTIAQYNWDFDNGQTASGTSVSTYYPNSGTFRVILENVSDSGCVDTIGHLMRVFPKPIASFTVNDSAQCLSGNLYEWNGTSFDSTAISAHQWLIDDDTVSFDQQVFYTFSDTGHKTIDMRVTNTQGCRDTLVKQVYVKHMPVPDFSTLKDFYCENEAASTLLPVTPGGFFTGKNLTQPDQYLPRILWEDTVKYWVMVNGCADSSFQTTDVHPLPQVYLGPDTMLCSEEYLDLNVKFWGSEYLWQDGKENPVYHISQPGTYYVTLRNICGTATDTMRISKREEDCRLYLPNAFTPDGDGLNDYFMPYIEGLEEMDMQIFNRWGQRVYRGDHHDKGWDGTFAGTACQIDVYYVVIIYKYPLGRNAGGGTQKGTIHLLR